MTASAAPAAALGESAVCTTCGTVHYANQGCPNCKPCSGCAAAIDALRAEFAGQLAALDRGLVEAGTTASRALAAAEANNQAWSAFEDGKRAIAAAQGTALPTRPARARRRSRTAPHPSRPSLSLVPPGGAA